MNISGITRYVNNSDRKTIFDTRKTLSLDETFAKSLRKCFKDNNHKHFVVIKYEEFQLD